MLFTTADLINVFPDYQGCASDLIPIKQVSTDSRKSLQQGLFIPLKGDHFNGHQFLSQAIEQGAVAAFWSELEEVPSFVPTNFPIIFVQDTLEALQTLAKVYREKVNPTVIGITGSNGKTTTKDIVASVVSTSYKTHHTIGNLNNHIGVPLTILSMPEDTEMLVLEMGMNHFGEIEVLTKIAEPDFAIITNIGESHIENLGSREGIAKAKAEILEGLKETGTFILDGDEPLLEPYSKGAQSVSVGFHDSNDFVINHLIINSSMTTFSLKGSDQLYQLPLLGKHHAKNAGYAIVLAGKLGISSEFISKGLTEIKSTTMRFERIKGKNGVTLINDAYNASPTSMVAAIEVLSQLEGYENKIVVLGDMYELGEDEKLFHQQVGESITDTIDQVCTIGELAREISQATRGIESQHFSDKESLISYLSKRLSSQTIILVKASRGMKLETVIESLL